MKRTAVLVIAALNQPVYRHYIRSYWRELIEYTNEQRPDIDVYLLLEHGTPRRHFRDLRDNIIADPDPSVEQRVAAPFRRPGVPSILSKTVHALDILSGDYDVFFRTNLSSMIMLPAFTDFVNSQAELAYGATWVWHDALRDDLVIHGHVGPDRPVETLSDLDSYPGNTFASGSGFFLSADDARSLVDQRDRLRYELADDVAIGLLFETCQHFPRVSVRLTPAMSLQHCLEVLHTTAAAHVRLEHFPVERAAALWHVMGDPPPWQ